MGYTCCSALIQINKGVMEVSFIHRGWCVDMEPWFFRYGFSVSVLCVPLDPTGEGLRLVP